MVNSLETFCVRLYGRPGIEAACLDLQDQAGVDVVFLLCCCWLGSRGILADRADLDALLEKSRTHSNNLCRPLRQVRRWYRAHSADDFDSTFYQRLKETELAAELRQMAVLEQWLVQRCGAPSGDKATGMDRRHAARDNCYRYFSLADIDLTPPLETQLNRLLDNL